MKRGRREWNKPVTLVASSRNRSRAAAARRTPLGEAAAVEVCVEPERKH